MDRERPHRMDHAMPKDGKSFELDLGSTGLVVIVPVIGWAFYTTFQGLKEITRQSDADIFGLVGAVIGSAAILSMLALSSWFLGTYAAAKLAGERNAINTSALGLITIAIPFVFFFTMSAFFSYTYYHANFFGLSSRLVEAANLPQRLADKITGTIDVQLDSARAELETATNVTYETNTWPKNMVVMIKFVGANDARIGEALQTSRLERETAVRKKLQEMSEAEKRSINADELIAPVQVEIEKLAAVASDAEQRWRKAEMGLDGTGIAECGSICNKAKDEQAKALKSIANLETGINQYRQDKAQAEQDIARLAGELRRLDPDTTVRKRLEGGAEIGAGPAAQTNLVGAAAELQKSLEMFKTDPEIAMQSSKTACETIVSTATSLQLQTGLAPDFECVSDTQAYTAALAAKKAFQTGEAAYRAECAPSGEGKLGIFVNDTARKLREAKQTFGNDPAKIEHAAATALSETRTQVSNCIEHAQALLTSAPLKTPIVLQPIRDEIVTFSEANAPDINKFNRAMTALRQMPTEAQLALSVASAQDLLIFLYKFLADYYKYTSRRRPSLKAPALVDLSDRPEDAPEVRARKALLRLTEPERRDRSQLLKADVENASLPDDVKANLRGLLAGLGRNRLAELRGNRYIIENAAIREIEDSVAVPAAPTRSEKVVIDYPPRDVDRSVDNTEMARDGSAESAVAGDTWPANGARESHPNSPRREAPVTRQATFLEMVNDDNRRLIIDAETRQQNGAQSDQPNGSLETFEGKDADDGFTFASTRKPHK